jgi:protein-S-isoprenylcysteine O-methyltransferase Ste14
MTALKSLLFLIVAPGMVAGYIPLVLLRGGSRVETGFFAYLAIPLWLVGSAILLWSFWNFFRQGHGTPAPVDPPKDLVVVGFYRYVRNPMYFGILLMLIGYFLWYGTWSLLIYTVIAFVIIHLFVTLYEEPTLRKKFGDSYEAYERDVPRWIPKLPAERPDTRINM